MFAYVDFFLYLCTRKGNKHMAKKKETQREESNLII